ncbi:MAG: hypothetical protein AAF614_29930 [Chloroflexota bacterium]
MQSIGVGKPFHHIPAIAITQFNPRQGNVTDRIPDGRIFPIEHRADSLIFP